MADTIHNNKKHKNKTKNLPNFLKKSAPLVLKMSGPAQWGLTSKGKKILIDNHKYRYHLAKVKNSKSWWYCTERRTQESCKSYAIVENEIIIHRDNHSHSNQENVFKAKEIESKHVKRAVENPYLPPRSILRDISDEMNHEQVIENMTKKESFSRKIRRERGKVLERPSIPTDYVPFFNMSDHGKSLLKTYRSWNMDGTFQTCPAQFSQLYFIFAITDTGKTIPAAYSLLPNKKCYGLLFEELKKIIEETSHLEKVMVDFEKVVHRQIEESFPNASVSGCLFHYKQAVRRQLGAKGCMALYNADRNFQTLVSMLYSLPFVPSREVVHVFETVVQPFFEDCADDWTEEG